MQMCRNTKAAAMLTLHYRQLFRCAVALLLGGLLHASPAIRPEQVERLDWVETVVTGGGCLSSTPVTRSYQTIESTADPCAASACYAGGIFAAAMGAHGGMVHRRISTLFRPDGNDSLVFKGLSSSFLTGYRSNEQLRTIVARRPQAMAKLDEFDKNAATAGTMAIVELSSYVLGLVGMIAGAVTMEKNETSGNALLYGGVACFGVGVVLGPTGEYINVNSHRKLKDAIELFNAPDRE